MRVCEVCQANAVCCVIDSREKPPERDAATGQFWQAFEAVGTHWFCRQHKRAAVKESLTDQQRCAAMVEAGA